MDIATLQAQLNEQGYCCIEDVIPSDKIGAIRDRVASDVWANNQLAPPTGYVPGFLRFNQSLVPYLAHPRVLGFAESVFGPHVRISMLTGTVNAPGIQRGALHADWPYNQRSQAHIPAPYPDAVMHLITMWMLTDFTEEMGATIIVPGSHKKSDHPRQGGPIDPLKPVPGERRLLGKAGTVAALDARMWHAIAPNTSQRERVAVIVRYAPWWLNLDTLRPGTVDWEDIVDAFKGKDSVVPGLPVEVFEQLPGNVKPLLRYSVQYPKTAPGRS